MAKTRDCNTPALIGKTLADIIAEGGNFWHLDNVLTNQNIRDSIKLTDAELVDYLGQLGVGASEKTAQRFSGSLTAQGEIQNFDFTGIANPISQKDIIDGVYEKGVDPNSNVIFQVGRYADTTIPNFYIGAIERDNNDNIYLFPNSNGIANGYTFVKKIDPTTGIITDVGAELTTSTLTFPNIRGDANLNSTDNKILYINHVDFAGIYFDCNNDTWIQTPNIGGNCRAISNVYSPSNNSFYISTQITSFDTTPRNFVKYNVTLNTMTPIGTVQNVSDQDLVEYMTGICASDGIVYFKENGGFNSSQLPAVLSIDPSSDIITKSVMNTFNRGTGRYPLETNGFINFASGFANGVRDAITRFNFPNPTTFNNSNQSLITNSAGVGGYLELGNDRVLGIPQFDYIRNRFGAVNATVKLGLANLSTFTIENIDCFPSENFDILTGCITKASNGDWYGLGRQVSSGETTMKLMRFVAGFKLDITTNPELTGGILTYTEGVPTGAILRKAEVGVDYELVYNEDGSGNIESVDIEKLQANGQKEIFYNIVTSNAFEV